MARRTPAVVGVVLAFLVTACAVAAAAVPPPSQGGPPLPASGPGTPTVALSPDALAHPEGAAVRNLLQRHFDAINDRDYPGWRDTVVAERVQAIPEPRFRKVYATTQDGSVRVDRIEDDGDDLLVRFRFVSVQALADAPEQAKAERVCWASSLPLVGHPRRIGQTGGGSSVARAC